MEGSYVILQEAALSLRDYTKNLIFDPERLAAIDERLDAINRLKRKHGGTLEALLARKQDMEEELQRVSSVEEELAKADERKRRHRRGSAGKSAGAFALKNAGRSFTERSG